MNEKYILANWLNNELSSAELVDFEDSEAFETYNKIKKYSNQLRAPAFDEDKILVTVLKIEKKKSKVIVMNNNWLLKIAAVFIIGFGLYFLNQNFITKTEIALNATKNSFQLPDNSQVVLNAGSEIEYKKWNFDNNRNLNLKGEAYFKVAKGKKFVVETDLGKVSVLGTQFVVKARKNRFDVSCFEGRVKVNYQKSEIVLTHGQSVIFENGNQTNLTVTTSKPDWIDNNIALNNENLTNIVDELERQYDVDIELKIHKNNYLFTGKIPSNNMDIALQIVSTTYNLKFKKLSANKIAFEQK